MPREEEIEMIEEVIAETTEEMIVETETVVDLQSASLITGFEI
jgi:hypothetical protein